VNKITPAHVSHDLRSSVLIAVACAGAASCTHCSRKQIRIDCVIGDQVAAVFG
jgi:glycerol kinase